MVYDLKFINATKINGDKFGLCATHIVHMERVGINTTQPHTLVYTKSERVFELAKVLETPEEIKAR